MQVQSSAHYSWFMYACSYSAPLALCPIAAAAGTPPKVPEGAQQVFMDTMLFWEFPQFLPASGFSMCFNDTSGHLTIYTHAHVCTSTLVLFVSTCIYLPHSCMHIHVQCT